MGYWFRGKCIVNCTCRPHFRTPSYCEAGASFGRTLASTTDLDRRDVGVSCKIARDIVPELRMNLRRPSTRGNPRNDAEQPRNSIQETCRARTIARSVHILVHRKTT